MSIHKCLLVAALLPAHAVSAAAFDLRATVASDELFRGISQNDGLTLALRGDCRFDSRLYLGARVLNNRSQGAVQGDAHLGYSKALNLFGLLQATADGGLSTSVYGGESEAKRLDDPDYVEGYASLGVGPLRVSGSYAPDYFGTGAAGYRVAGQLKLPLPFSGLSAAGVLGWNGGAGVERLIASRNGGSGGRSYADYSLLLNQELPLAFALFGQIGGASVDVDGSRAPTFLLGLRWRYGV